jgi:hypothetical protein
VSKYQGISYAVERVTYEPYNEEPGSCTVNIYSLSEDFFLVNVTGANSWIKENFVPNTAILQMLVNIILCLILHTIGMQLKSPNISKFLF